MSNSRTALYDAHLASHARMVPFAGWDMPVQYSSIIEEHKAVRTAVGMFDVSHMARLSFNGPKAEALLEGVFTNRVGNLREGQVRYGLICNADGGTLDDVLVYRWPQSFAMVVNASNHAKILAWLQQHAQGEVPIDDVTAKTVMLAVQGPKAVEAVAGLFADDVAPLRYFYATNTRYREQNCVVSRTGYTGEDGYEITVPNELGRALWDDLLARGVRPCGLGARDTLRLEAAMPLYGHELTEKIDPLQAGLGWAVKLDKNFIGREALQNAHEAESQRPRRVGLVLEGKRAARQECVIFADESTPIGVVTSGSFAPGLEQSIGMGYISPRHAAPGTKLFIDIRDTRVPAVVVPLPFYQRNK